LKLKHHVEYVSVRVLAFILQHLSYRGALRVGWIVAWLGFVVFRFRVRAAQSRIREVFGSRFSEREVRNIAWLSWRNFMFSVVELIRIPVSTSEWLWSVIDDEDTIEKVSNHLKKGQGAIVAVAHMGSWEMAALACLARKIPLFSIAAPQKNPMVDDFVNQLRSKTGFETVLRDSSVLKKIIRKIRAGKVLAILPDVRSRTEAMAISFFGKTANVAGGMGFIAKQTGVPVFPCIFSRIGWNRHRFHIFDPIWPDSSLDKQADGLRITQAVFDIFDRRIREEPEQWFWFNKRWILDPLEVVPVPLESPPGSVENEKSDQKR